MKEKTKIILAIVITFISTLSITALAVFRASAENITFTSTKTTKENVNDSLDELYEKANQCQDGKICLGDIDKTDDTNKKCRRAKILHSEVCLQNISSWYCSSTNTDYYGSDIKNKDTIIYGNTKVVNGKLQSGDAFTCDVNGDGIYNEETERFYYVSDLYTGGETGSETFDTNYAVLIYYNNTTLGVADNTSASLIAYNSANVNNLGPVTAVANLPSTTQWSNVSLKNQTRQIRNEIGTTSTSAGNIPLFVYTDKAARLITAQEINKACNIIIGNFEIGQIDKPQCRFLLENTKYSNNDLNSGYWLETPHSTYVEASIMFTFVYARNISNDSRALFANYGVRPAIEILKADIAY